MLTEELYSMTCSTGHVEDKEMPGVGKTLFFHENGRSSNFYYDAQFEPEFVLVPEIPSNVYVL
jgi:hypothetical protein